jgi:hypothetical protein
MNQNNNLILQNNPVLLQSLPIMIKPITQIPTYNDYYKPFYNQELDTIQSNTDAFNNKLGYLLDDINTKLKKQKIKKKIKQPRNCNINLNDMYNKISQLSINLNNFNTYITNTLDTM